jgi:NADH dehydrogenase FAD-containing subunit
MTIPNHPRVVIVVAGFAGLWAARPLPVFTKSLLFSLEVR